ncbi:hypothetical protein CL656_05865 [bacterium]|nr:hypothetical protein [bacterium]
MSLKIQLGEVISQNTLNKLLQIAEGNINDLSEDQLHQLEDQLSNATSQVTAPVPTPTPTQLINEGIATPGYIGPNFTGYSNTEEDQENENVPLPRSADKERALEDVFTTHFNVRFEKISESHPQIHLRERYNGYYATIRGVGICIAINNQYAQATRILAVDKIDRANLAIQLLHTTMVNQNKLEMDRFGFRAIRNTYNDYQELIELYIRKIEEEITRFNQGYATNPSNPSNPGTASSAIIAGSTITASTINSIQLTLDSNREIDLSGRAEEIWERIDLPATIIMKTQIDKEINTIVDFINLPITATILGRIGSTYVRDIINAMLGLENDKKISGKNSNKTKDLANKQRLESAKELLKKLVLDGGLGEKAKQEYEAYLEQINEIDLSGRAEEIWERIELPVKITYEGQEIEIETIQNFLELHITSIINGKIGSTPVRGIINAMLELEEDEKISSHHCGPKHKANKERVELAKESLKKLVLNEGLGEKAKQEYEAYLEEINEINLTGSAEEIWERIKLPATIDYEGKEIEIKTIQNFINLPITAILRGNMGKIPVREIINSMLGLEGEKKITTQVGKKEKGLANRSRIENAKEVIKKLAEDGKLGEKAKQEYEAYLEDKIDLSRSAEDIWLKIKGQTIKTIGTSSNKSINTIQDFLNLTFSAIAMGKIRTKPVRDIINAMFQLEGDEKITSHTGGRNSEANKKRVENARILLKDKALAGELGEEAQRDIQKIIESENIQNEISQEIQEI